ncbi:glucuronate isomerase [Proteiniclasticum sp.]|uniref:glucuronate isomerase n=1 Tax=Proteiniclasticum sp. TaxID=2053595 RepID=UPI0028A1402C|nr:glucuronate isomerase [Proteiniclasticum sp.]
MSIINDKFMLKNETGRKLYEEYAKDMPIYDYHCHLNPKMIAENARFKNITDIWLGGDHYKWRAMRSCGFSEEYITGSKSDFEKFEAFCETIPYTIGNPLYHWSHMEMKKYFGIDLTINKENAKEIWERANEVISGEDFNVRNLITQSNVKMICTTDDLIDTLEYHDAINADDTFDTKVLPALRPDKLLNIEKEGYKEYMEVLSGIVGYPVTDTESLLKAVENRVDFFHDHGARLSDHALDTVFFEEYTAEEIEAIIKAALSGEKISKVDSEKYRTFILVKLGAMYKKRDWAQQYHIGAIRNNNSRMQSKLGADVGFDSINDELVAVKLSKLMDTLDRTDNLPKTILYNLNARDNDVIGTMIGNFQGETDGIMKIQFGSGWWFNDQKDGMEKQMKSLANLSLLRKFVGMLTDSRSFISYPRHDYFRRILCNLLGQWAEEGEAPDDMELLGKMVKEISFENAVQYFNM